MAIFVLIWIAFSIMVGVAADSRGREWAPWALLSLLTSPLLGFILLLAVGAPKPNARTHKKCAACAEWCANEAKVCKHCGHAFPSASQVE